MRHNIPFVMAIVGVLLVKSASAQWPRNEGAHAGHHALARFETAVRDYVELHRRLEMPLPPRVVTSDAEQILRATHALAAAIRAARPGAVAGDIFGSAASAAIRSRIEAALQANAYDATVLLAALRADNEPGAARPVVNGAFPWNAGNAMWAFVLQELPVLPNELEYRFVEGDLVLLDIDANLVVDILPNALPAR